MLSNLLHANLCLFVFDAIFAEWYWQFIAICSCDICHYFLGILASVAEWLVRDVIRLKLLGFC